MAALVLRHLYALSLPVQANGLQKSMQCKSSGFCQIHRVRVFSSDQFCTLHSFSFGTFPPSLLFSMQLGSTQFILSAASERLRLLRRREFGVRRLCQVAAGSAIQVSLFLHYTPLLFTYFCFFFPPRFPTALLIVQKHHEDDVLRCSQRCCRHLKYAQINQNK